MTAMNYPIESPTENLLPDPTPTTADYAGIPTLEEARADMDTGTFWVALADVVIGALDEKESPE